MVSGEPLGLLYRFHFGFVEAQWAFEIRRHSRSLFNVCDVTHLGPIEAMSATVAAPTLQSDRMSANPTSCVLCSCAKRLETVRKDIAFIAFERLFAECGLPNTIRSDNGVDSVSPNACSTSRRSRCGKFARPSQVLPAVS
jgi:hypothetical protein